MYPITFDSSLKKVPLVWPSTLSNFRPKVLCLLFWCVFMLCAQQSVSRWVMTCNTVNRVKLSLDVLQLQIVWNVVFYADNSVYCILYLVKAARASWSHNMRAKRGEYSLNSADSQQYTSTPGSPVILFCLGFGDTLFCTAPVTVQWARY